MTNNSGSPYSMGWQRLQKDYQQFQEFTYREDHDPFEGSGRGENLLSRTQASLTSSAVVNLSHLNFEEITS